MNELRRTILIAAAGLAGVFLGASFFRLSPVRAQGAREFTIKANQFAFAPVRIEVQKDDLVQIRFTAKDVAHSFTVDVPYRISKRAGAGQSIVFEFRADEAGRFPFYCNLTQDERCKQMKGELVVR